MSEREEGWYWTLLPNPYGQSTWNPCSYRDNSWTFGEHCVYPEHIGPRIPAPDETLT